MNRSERTVKVEIEVSEKFILDQLITAKEQGISYWAAYCHFFDWPADQDCDGITMIEKPWVQERDEMTGQPGEKIYLDIPRGLKLAAEKYPHVLDEDEQDADTADVLIQLCAFGEVVYG